MVNNRDLIKKAHEKFQANLFLEYFNHRYHTNFRVISEPDPPDAIIQSKNTTRWIEITTAYWSTEFAKDVNSYVTKDEIHKPIHDGGYACPDALFAINFVDVIKKKLAKIEYKKFAKSYGKGYLVVSIQYPLFDVKSLRYVHKEWQKSFVIDAGCFKSIYIVYRSSEGYKVKLWCPYRTLNIKNMLP